MRIIAIGVFLLSSQFIKADDEISYILNSNPAPSGVVFEMLTHEESSWPVALTYIQKSAERLRTKFPDMPVVIVSHGMEEFALVKSSDVANVKVQKKVQSLLKNNIKVEVCGTFAEWNGYESKDFPEYITVVDQAPVSIDFYEQDGFEVIVITEDKLESLQNSQ